MAMVALLVSGSAILLSCEQKAVVQSIDTETLITQQSDTLLMINTKNGEKNYRFQTPLLERYELAREPYMEFRHGIDIETYNDTTGMVESTLVADYAIFWEKQRLWEAKGNVVAVNANGQILHTQQLFWNQRTKKIYSNVDTRITQQGDVITGVGFEADEDFGDFTFRRPRGKVTMDTTPTPVDSTASAASPSPSPSPTPPAPAPVPVSRPPAPRRPTAPPVGKPARLSRPAEMTPVKRLDDKLLQRELLDTRAPLKMKDSLR